MADQHEVDLDSIIDRLLEVRGSRPGKQVQLLEAEIRYLCTKAREIFISQPILLELEAPIKVRIHCPLLLLQRLSPLFPHYIADTRLHSRSAAISTVNTMTCCACSSTVASLPRPTTSSSATT